LIRLRTIPFAFTALSLLPGCLIDREITDFAAHPTYNNYKVETKSTYDALLTAWIEYDAWTCQKLGDAFHCTKVDYEVSKRGFQVGATVTPSPVPPTPAAPRATGHRGRP
jgi:hypothetical protein